MPQTWIVLYTVAVTGRPLRTLAVGVGVTSVMVTVVLALSAHDGLELLRISGWVVAVLFCGVDVRIYRQYVASVLERAERAERTREEEAARRVAEERLRIARDLHDLLAHSITLIGVQTSVAAHILTVDPERLDRQAVAASLDDIAETCREARAELRTTLRVLRGTGQEGGERPRTARCPTWPPCPASYGPPRRPGPGSTSTSASRPAASPRPPGPPPTGSSRSP